MQPHEDIDLAFQVEISPKPVIPTFSQWGLIILGLYLSVIGAVMVRQRMRVAVNSKC